MTASSCRSAAEVVAWLGAVQAQDYSAAKWALGLRAPGLTDTAVEQAFTDGAILRTHVMRPTWHFVTPRDIRWMLALTAPQIDARMTPYNRHLELDRRLFRRSHRLIARALEGGRTLTRADLAATLTRAGIALTTQRLAHLMMQAEIEGVVCSGPRRGKQSTYALLDERVPPAPALGHDEALAELARRYLASHGPATIRDFAWWSGLKMAEAKRGIEAATPAAVREAIDARTFYAMPSAAAARRPPRSAHLLPVYDEYVNPYRDRDAIVDPRTRAFDPSLRDDGGHYIIVEGMFVGTWRWREEGTGLSVRLTPYRRLTADAERRLRRAAGQLGLFVERRVTLARRGSKGRRD